MRDLISFLRDNPQATILLAICVVLGLGTLIALLIATATSGSGGSGIGGGPDASVITLLQALR
jgi:hypothetical protein